MNTQASLNPFRWAARSLQAGLLTALTLIFGSHAACSQTLFFQATDQADTTPGQTETTILDFSNS